MGDKEAWRHELYRYTPASSSQPFPAHTECYNEHQDNCDLESLLGSALFHWLYLYS